MQFVAFDLGNVLVDVDFEPFWKVADEFHHDTRSVIDFYEKAEMSGLVDYHDVFIKELNATYEEANYLIDAWNQTITVNDQMCNFVRCLKHEGFKIAFLSNIGSTHKIFLRARGRPLMDLADIQHMSCEVGVVKPSILYYQSFLMQHDDFAGCMYLDDRPENIIAASKCKFDSIKFELDSFKDKPPSVLKKELIKIRERLLRGC